MADTIFEKTCRTCNSESNDLRNIFEARMFFNEESPPILIFEALNNLGFIEKEIKEGDDLPQNICIACFERLRTSFNFKRLINESQNEFEVALKYEKRRRGNSMNTSKDKILAKSVPIDHHNYDKKYEKEASFFISSDEDYIEFDDVEEIDEEVLVEEKMELAEKDAGIKDTIESSSKECVVCKRVYKSLEALGFHQAAMHRGISILQE